MVDARAPHLDIGGAGTFVIEGQPMSVRTRTALARSRPVLVVVGGLGVAPALATAVLAVVLPAVLAAAGLPPVLVAVRLPVRVLAPPLPEAALAANSSTACSRVMVSAVLPSGREAFSLPCFT
jgi:hypothetical protein